MSDRTTSDHHAGRVRLVALALLVLTAACAYPETPWDAPLPEDRFPITVHESRSMVEVPVDPELFSLTYVDIAALESLAAEYLDAGRRYGPVIVALPVGGPNDQLAVARGAEIRDVFYRNGVAYKDVQGTSYDAAGRGDAPLIVMFDRYVAEAPDCHREWRDFSRTANGENTFNFGCANQANLAAAVTDPGDLIGPRGETSSDAARRGEVLARYRSGQTTRTERSEEESAGVADVE